MISKIGIKLADGTFFPILDENASSEHTLELTTVREHQESVQINLFKKTEDKEPEYIGSLIVEEIADGAAGEPTINLKIKLDEEKNLSAEAIDEGSGSKQSLKVSLKTLDTDTFDVPDFDLSAMEETNEIGIDPNREDVFVPEAETDYSAFTVTEEKKEEKKKGFPVWAIILLIILCIGALVFAILLLTKKLPFADKNKIAKTDITSTVEKTETKTDMNATTSNPPKEDTAAKEAAAAEAKRKAEEAAAAAEAKRKAEEAAAAEAKRKAEEAAAAEAKRKAEEAAAAEAKKKNDIKAPKVNADGSVRYKIKWGDTLWDLSESFYKTPWKYKKIADYNKIKNPNLIISGTYIDIPPK